MLYLFDGYNLLHAGALRDRQELIDRLAGYLALRGARGIVVFDGGGESETVGPLEVRFAASADEAIERLAAAARGRETVCVVSSDRAIHGTAGQEARLRSAGGFMRELLSETGARPETGLQRSRIEEALDDETRDRLERWRRGST